MSDVVIANPVINKPFREPDRHFVFGDTGITNQIAAGRRPSSYFQPIAQPRSRKGGQLQLDTQWTRDRIEETKNVNEIRARVSQWRQGKYAGVTPMTQRLLKYWTDESRIDAGKALFFCQVEALETAIYITEVAKKYGDAWIENRLREANDTANPGMPRVAFKMATGSGKTVVMGMLIAWQALNKQENQQDARFSDAFLIITPGITIRDRLRVLLPNDPQNYYRQRDILPPDLLERLERAKIVITNYHSFLQREKYKVARLTKVIAGADQTDAFRESPDEVVRRVCRELGTKKQIVVLNDEAHHCYAGKPEDPAAEKLTGEERDEAKAREAQARIWLNGVRAVQRKIGVKAVYDLSATPFFLRGSGWPEGTLFPWVVSDFSLIDAIEAGIVKVPRVPVSDNQMSGTLPTYRALWEKIRDGLPKKGRSTEELPDARVLPKELEGALQSLYLNYEKYYQAYEADEKGRAAGRTPPVFIVVCNNTSVSKLVCDYIAGWEKPIKDGTVLVPGALPLFSNVADGRWISRPNTVLVDSNQLESGDAMSKDFKAVAATEIERFKDEYRERFPDRDVDALTDEDLLREVMNTVGKPGRLGEHVRCVVSVSMLTEGWDANTVTHVLGVRAFGTQLLCEQVVGRALRRMSYALNAEGRFDAEYAEVYGVPFSFIPCSGSTGQPTAPRLATRVHAIPERAELEVLFPRVVGYRYDLGEERLEARFTDESRFELSTEELPTKTEVAPVIGSQDIHDLEKLRQKRDQEVVFLLAKLVLERYFEDPADALSRPKPWLFPQLLRITAQWYRDYVTCKDNTFKQLLYFQQYAHTAAEKLQRAIARAQQGTERLMPILNPYDTWASTRDVDFDTLRPVYETRPDRCHVSHVVADTNSWEQKLAQSLEDMDEVLCYVKNDRQPGFLIPYTHEGASHNYMPDFVARIRMEGEEPLNLIIEVSGEAKKEKAAKTSTAGSLWVPAVNNHGGLGQWGFMEVKDPWNAQTHIRAVLAGVRAGTTRAAAVV